MRTSAVRIPKNILSVKLLTGRFEVRTARKVHSFRFEQLTEAQETKLRELAAPLPIRRAAPRRRETGQPKKRTNYAASVLWMVGGELKVLEV